MKSNIDFTNFFQKILTSNLELPGMGVFPDHKTPSQSVKTVSNESKNASWSPLGKFTKSLQAILEVKT